ncbi:hypothetical protein REC12_11555 [Desulfosporosinus sp. PR]|uniref:hypothetical protein n=1 Tax=Candidatus Desulfosporosinus nitrosoreducens TaxID=3401928 RepID=UPI0027F8ADAC|nr:hypothetical protein [Desulfosporosinus sp. PR]MDQ7094225.1 hypothetical protein [Desulfosporosinus sp. PR]
MKYRSLDSNGDYTMGNMQAFLSDIDAVVQAIKTNLLLLKGEWWEDTSEGLPLFQNILGQPGTSEKISAADLLIKERILATQGVLDIINFQSSYENRKYTVVSCSVNTIYGTVTVSGVSL